MITLGGVLFDGTAKCIVWSDQFKVSKITQTNNRTLGGQLVSYELALVEGFDITLEAQTETGWLTKAQVEAVKALSEAVGATYLLDFEGDIFTVQFRNDEPPAVDMTPIIFRSNSEPGDYFTGIIKLRTV